MFHRRKSHAASHHAGGVFYTFSFSLPLGTDIHELANKLMACGLASAASVAGSETPLLGRNYSKSIKTRKLLEDVLSLEEVQAAKLSPWVWAKTHPRLAFKLRRQVAKTVLKKDRTELFKNIDFEKVRAGSEKADLEIFEQMKLVGSMGAVDRVLYSPIYLASQPFIRLDLKPFYTNCRDFHDGEILAFLLLHRSGTALLSFATYPGAGKTTDDLLGISSPSRPEFDMITAFQGLIQEGSEGVETILSSQAAEGENTDGYIALELGQPITITEVYWAYSNAIRSFVPQPQAPGYLCYTTLFVEGLECCGSRRRWMANHSSELAGVALRHEAYGRLNQPTIDGLINSARGLHVDESRFYLGGNALIVNWKFDRENFAPDLNQNYMTIAVIENAMLQHWQLHSLQQMVDLSEDSTRAIPAIERELIGGLTEFGRATLSHGTAQEISAEILNHLHTSDLYARLTERLSLLRQLAESNRAKSGDRRNVLAATLGAAAAVLFGLPAIRDSLSVISQAKFGGLPGQAISPIQSWAAQGPNSVIITYVGVLAFFFGIALVASLLFQQRRRQPKKATQVGVEWGPKRIIFTSREHTYRGGLPAETEDEA